MTIALCIVGYGVAGFLAICLLERIKRQEVPHGIGFDVLIWPLCLLAAITFFSIGFALEQFKKLEKPSKLRRWIRGF